MGRIKLKLGMYSDGKKFPHSGGYVWIQEGAANKYTSVYKVGLEESKGNFCCGKLAEKTGPVKNAVCTVYVLNVFTG